MRAWAVPVALLLLVGALAGCMNKDTPGGVTPAGDKTDPTSPTTGGSNGLPVKVLASVPLTLTVGGGAWVEPGTSVPVEAKSSAADATYLWALGPLPGTVDVKAAYDTGTKSYISPGESKAITFDTAGSFLMHCHPHPYMTANVTVLDGYTGPATVTVEMVDGTKPSESRFVPENIVIGKGTKVVYKNNGSQAHTSTLMTGEPPLKLLDLKAAKGEVALEGNGWQRVRAIAVTPEGRVGVTDHAVYVSTFPVPDFPAIAAEFPAGGLTGAGLPQEPVTPFTANFVWAHNGTFFFNFTAKDAVAQQNEAAPNNALVDVHVKLQGSEQDAATASDAADGSLTARLPAGSYTIVIVPKQGAGIKVDGVIDGTYEPTPPAPTKASGGDDHGGHAH